MQAALNKAVEILRQSPPPPLPEEVVLLREELSHRYPNTATIAHLIGRNPELLNPFLELVNHRIFRPDMPIRDARSAVNLLGLDDLQTLFLASLLTEHLTESPQERDILAHGVRSGIAAAELAYWVHPVTRAEAYLAGLTQNIGGIFIERTQGQFTTFFSRQLSHPFSAYQEELGHYGTAHTYVGALVAKRWHLADTLSETIVLHHDPQFISHTAGHEKARTLIAMIFVANYVVSSTLGETFLTEELKGAYHLGRDTLQLPDSAIRAATAAVLKWGERATLVAASH